MYRRPIQTACAALAVLFAFSIMALAQEFPTIQLPEPRMTGGRPLMEALKERQSLRDYSAEKLPLQELSNILWAGFGINRPESGRRTAPSAMNRQEIDIYAATADGLYLYDASANALKTVLTEDIRAITGGEPWVKEAAVNFIFVADFARMADVSMEKKIIFSAICAGCISQNIALYCASEGLATVVRAAPENPELVLKMKLGPEQRIMLAQSAGYPKK